MNDIQLNRLESMPQNRQNEGQNADHKSGPEPKRRGFLKKLWIGLGFLALAEFLVICFGFLKARDRSEEEGKPGALIEAGPVQGFEPDSVTAFVQGQFYLSRLKDEGFLAISRQCTHLGCTVPWVADKKQFVCPCHASAFDITGDVVSAPASRALDLYEVYIENDRVMVNTGKRIRRSGFDAKQVVKIPSLP